MAKYKVYYVRREVEYTVVEADSAEEAEQLVDDAFADYDWDYCDGTMTGDLLYGETEEV